VAVRVVPVWSLCNVTVAPTRTPPVRSVTVPEIDPVIVCARAVIPSIAISTKTAKVPNTRLEQRRVEVNMGASF
jgi:hypothetical protein